MPSDLTAIVLCHNEGRIVFETVFSIFRSWEFYQARVSNHGKQLEVCFVLDSHTDETIKAIQEIARSYSSQYSFKLIEVSHRDPGLSRNSGLELSDSGHVMVIDGDDLISSDFIASYFMDSPKSFIAHPEYLVTFGMKSLIWRQPEYARISGKESLVLAANPYDTCSIGPRELYLNIRYSEARQDLGMGYEDWHFILESCFHGVRHDILKNTIKYTRIKPQSRLRADKAQSSLMPYSLFIELLTSP